MRINKIFSLLFLMGVIFSGKTVFCSQNYIISGTTYTFPDEGDTDWGQNVTDWAGAVTVQLSNISNSTTSLKSKFDAVASSTQSILSGNATTYLNINSSTQTKNAGLILNGSLTTTGIYFVDGTTQSTVGISSAAQSVDSYLMKNTGVSAGTYGGLLNYPIITIGTDGRVTNASLQSFTASTQSVAGFDVTLGPISDNAAIVSSNTVEGLNRCLQILGAAGLTNSTTAQGNILIKRGTYNWSGATIPAGISIYALPGSSVVITPTYLSTGTIVTNYGRVENISFDFQNKNFSGDQFVAKTNSISRNVYFYGAKNANDLVNGSIFAIKQSSNVTVEARFNQVKSWTAGSNKNSSAFLIQGSSDCNLKVNIDGEFDTVDAANKGLFFYYSDHSKNILQKDFTWTTPGTRLAFIETGTGLMFQNGIVNVSSASNSFQGIIDFYPDALPSTSVSISSCVVRNVNFFINGPYSGSLIGIGGQGVSIVEGILLQNNFAYCLTNCSMNFYSIQQEVGTVVSRNALILGNVLRGVGIGTDSGTNTIKSGNYRDSTSF